jgi:hypothetical protein
MTGPVAAVRTCVIGRPRLLGARCQPGAQDDAPAVAERCHPGRVRATAPAPRHFEQLAHLVTEDMVSAPCGPDPEPYLQAIRAYQDAGFDEVCLGQVGGRLEGAFDFLATQVLPQARET